MTHQFTVGRNREIPLPDDICTSLNIELGDILICEVTKDKTLILYKHDDQTLTDAQIESSGKLVRVVEFNSVELLE